MPDRTEEFVRLFALHQRRVYAFILTLLPHRSDAEDVLQETSAVLWRNFDDFQPGTNFAAWACEVARRQVLAFARQKRHDAMMRHSFVKAVAQEVQGRVDELEGRYRALEKCLEKLSPRDRELIQRRYREGASVVDVAAAVQRPAGGLYKAYQRIRAALLDCVDRTLAAEANGPNNSRNWLRWWMRWWMKRSPPKSSSGCKTSSNRTRLPARTMSMPCTSTPACNGIWETLNP
jgi:RNA polymerase sigma-70 factor (ECF subfamily)